MKKLDFNGFLTKTRCLILLFPVIYDTWRLLLVHMVYAVSKSVRGWKILEISPGNPVYRKARGGGGGI